MADISLSDNKKPVSVKFKFNSMQNFTYTVKVYDSTNDVVLFNEKGKSNGKTEFDLGHTDTLNGMILIINWTIIDMEGAGNNFSAEAIVFQEGDEGKLVERKEHQVCSGTTDANAVSTSTQGKFIIV